MRGPHNPNPPTRREDDVALVLVTGAGRGIGLARTERMSGRGWDVYATARSAAALDSLERMPNVHAIPLDITDRSAVTGLADLLPAALNGVVNNAGIIVNGPVEGLSLDDLSRQLDINVTGQIGVTQAALPKIREGRGRVVFMSSVAGLITLPGTGAYSASKYAVESLADALRIELRPWRIPVSLIEPGPTRTDMWGDILDEHDRMAAGLNDRHRELYAAHLAGNRKLPGRTQKLAGDPNKVVKAVEHAPSSKHPKRRYLCDSLSRVQKALVTIMLECRADGRAGERRFRSMSGDGCEDHVPTITKDLCHNALVATAGRALFDRRLTDVIKRRMADEAVLVLTGPRTVGKSTLLQAVAADSLREVVDLDDLDVRSAVAADPSLFASADAPVLIDEYQKVPELLDAIKAELGRGLAPGRFVLAGSTRYETLPRAAQALTGRAHVMMVWPLSQGEIGGTNETFVERLLIDPRQLVGTAASSTSRDDYVARVVAGGLPLALRRQSAARTRWFADYVNLVCERDVLEISRVQQRALLPRLLTRLAGQTASLLNVAQAARTTNIETRTAETYTKLLEAVFLLYRLPAWGTTVGSKAGATAKIHIIDSGLAAHLLRLTESKLSNRSPTALAEFGHLLETFAVGEVLKQVSWLDDAITAGHWRTRDGAEVDLVLERSDGGVVGIEIKAGSRVQASDSRHLAALADRLGDTWLGGVVLYTGNRSFTVDGQRAIVVLPLDRLWSENT